MENPKTLYVALFGGGWFHIECPPEVANHFKEEMQQFIKTQKEILFYLHGEDGNIKGGIRISCVQAWHYVVPTPSTQERLVTSFEKMVDNVSEGETWKQPSEKDAPTAE